MPSVAKILSLLALATSLRVSSTWTPWTPYHYAFRPGTNLIFNEEAYRGRSFVYGYCPENYRGLNTSCTLVHVDELGQRRLCALDVQTHYHILEPSQLQLLLLGAHRAIVSLFDPTLRKHEWQVCVVNFLDCSHYEPRGLEKLVPVKFIVYEKSFYAIVNSNKKGMPCYRESRRSQNVQRCWIKFNDLGSIIGPRYWYKQKGDNDNFMMAPLQEDTNVLEDFLMIRLFRHGGKKAPVFAEAKIQGWAKGRSEHLRMLTGGTQHKSVSLRKYTVMDTSSAQRWLDPSERIAYSTHAGYIGVCAKKEDWVLICSQYDDDGLLQWEHTFHVDRSLVHFHEMAVMNLAGNEEEGSSMLLVMTSCKDPACHARGRIEYRVARIDLASYQLETVHTIPKLYSCDRYANRASVKLFEDGPGRYCFTGACYEDFYEESHKGKNRKRSRQLKVETHCFTDRDLENRQVVEYVELGLDWSEKIVSWTNQWG